MEPQTFYEPTDRGFEAKVAERLAFGRNSGEEKAREPTSESGRREHVPFRCSSRLLARPVDPVLGPRVLFAILILIVTHFVAKGVKRQGTGAGAQAPSRSRRRQTIGTSSAGSLTGSSGWSV